MKGADQVPVALTTARAKIARVGPHQQRLALTQHRLDVDRPLHRQGIARLIARQIVDHFVAGRIAPPPPAPASASRASSCTPPAKTAAASPSHAARPRPAGRPRRE